MDCECRSSLLSRDTNVVSFACTCSDFALQKKRLLASIDDIRQVRARLRQMKMAVEDAARDLRRAKAELEVARERLAER